MSRWKNKSQKRVRRHMRVRNKIAGTAERPRMSVYRSNNHMTVQFIDDEAAVTLVAVSSQQAEFKGQRATVELAKSLGSKAAELAKGKGITNVVFDRGGYRYGGRISALADAAREGGLTF